jgi:hypothetical protein
MKETNIVAASELARLAERGRIRYSVDLPCQVDAQLEQMAAEKGMKKSELLRSALKMLMKLDQLEKDGFDTGGWKTDGLGNRETVQLLVA